MIAHAARLKLRSSLALLTALGLAAPDTAHAAGANPTGAEGTYCARPLAGAPGRLLAPLPAAASPGTPAHTQLLPEHLRPSTAGFADPWDDAKRAAEDFEEEVKKTKRLDQTEITALVTAICEAEEEDRKSVGSSAADRVRGALRESETRLTGMREKALALLAKVLSDSTFKAKSSDAENYKKRVNEAWESYDRSKRSLRGANHPVVSYLAEQGQSAHANKQSECHLKELPLGDGRADCIIFSGTTVQVWEFKPYNSRAVSKGQQQVAGYVAALRKLLENPETKAKLASDKDSRFNGVTLVEGGLRCYVLCPEIDADGEFKRANAEWRSC